MKVSRRWYSAFGTAFLVMLVSCMGVSASALAKPAHHKAQHTHKHKRKPHRQNHKKSECVLVVNGEKTVTRGECPPVNTESSPTTITTTTVVPAEGEHSCEHNPLPGQCTPTTLPAVCSKAEVEAGTCPYNVIIDPIVACSEVGEVPAGYVSCGEPPEEGSPCAEKICEPLPEEACPEKQEIAGPKG